MTEVTLFDFAAPPNPARKHYVPVGPHPIRNWSLAKITATDCVAKYGHAILLSNGTPDIPATLWRVEREVA